MPFFRQYEKTILLCATVLIWFSFYEIWGLHNWTKVNLFVDGWWLDTIGHFTAGVVGTINLLCVYQVFDSKRIFCFAGNGHLVATITGKMLFFAFVWEVGELLYDMQIESSAPHGTYLIRAQLNSLDTVLDIGATLSAAFLTSLVYVGYNALREKVYPDEYQKEELKEFSRMASYLAEKTAAYRKEHRKVFRMWLRKALKKYFAEKNR
ncbi:MAG: hypothetical protein HZC03_02535 [Candidatus Lloydbacteria bacterium]|nr:hypothetical protein [Candidatus Lloydbacteria bacterium]